VHSPASRGIDRAVSETLILFFGRIGDRLGRERRLALDGPCTVGDLRRRLVEADPAADILLEPGVRASVDREIAGDDMALSPGQEVAFFPVFSGG
jgi:molybdopterin synthase sulfur carrier subunit